ncbi:MAG: hypothetical protein CSA53_00145 [Gammaproteobacteria bacterium]|nr:MAG: hypothetical protein CSA53_00145 [Gammaproteobacteria bacterium]
MKSLKLFRSNPSLSAPKPLATAVALSALSVLCHQAQAQLEEVIVTAQKKSENLQEVAIAVSAFSEDTLRNASIENIIDVTAMTPGFAISNYNPTTPAPYIRGVGTNSSSVGDDASVGVFIDEVYAGRAGAFNSEMFDVARVEVLRGPQGTLYGRNVAGGAVSVITNNPTEELEGRLELTAGNYDLRGLSGVISGPLSDDGSTRGRLAVSGRERDGWVSNVLTGSKLRDEDNISVRGKLDADLTDSLTMQLGMDYAKDDLTGPAARATVAQLPGNPNDKVSLYDDGFTERTIKGASMKLVWDVAGGALTSITAYRSNDYAFFDDTTGNWTLALTNEADEDSRQFTQEFRFTAETDTLDYTFGLYFFDEDVDRWETFDSSRYFGAAGSSRPEFDGSMASRSISAFGELAWTISDQLTAIFGGRYTRDEKEAELKAFNPDQLGFLAEPYDVSPSENWKRFTPKLGLEYQASDSMLLYATWAQGYKAGGFNGLAPTRSAAITPFNEEIATNYEIGMKGDFLDQTLRFNAAFFYTDYSDLQNFYLDQELRVISATSDAEIYGAELELWYSPLDGLDVFLAGSWLETEYKSFPANPAVEGNQLMRAPKTSASSGVQYRMPLADIGDLLVRVDAMYSDKMYFNTRNSDAVSADSYTLVNARIALELYSGWELSLWGKNITDEAYVQHSFTLYGDDSHVIYGEPSMWGVTAAYNF